MSGNSRKGFIKVSIQNPQRTLLICILIIYISFIIRIAMTKISKNWKSYKTTTKCGAKYLLEWINELSLYFRYLFKNPNQTLCNTRQFRTLFEFCPLTQYSLIDSQYVHLFEKTILPFKVLCWPLDFLKCFKFKYY